MPKLSKEAKQRLQQLFKGGQFAIRWGFIPVVLYLVYFGDERLAILYRNHLMDRENEDVNLHKAKEGVHFITLH
ncbi:mitochondrial coenzyme A transporter SLC25A42 [Platysternon megacephalum]|uniref:Mitochondrial import receptor subunit TOM7 homolog n=1 Tax=Platysternon megacephalum TaxID=55544 RepID=A0A4D9EMB2_9SAUR|nr:mitochondrial coenzyme A transporter SLC25A42 [Platysternon megacephalum]